ncbi:MAG: TraB/GumN family protein [Planctomycetota bacterium]|nr:TraB/GumN family protein [Planctomycetota bacterium]
MPKRCSVFVAGILVWAASQSYVNAEQATSRPSVPESFTRFVDDGNGGGALETADVAFSNRDGVAVHLIGAIHMGEKAYYSELNKDFQYYDAVLYELVKPRDAAPPQPGEPVKSSSGIGQLQHFLKTALDLDFQLDDVDYSAPNFVHADMDAETFRKMQEARGETFEQLFLQQLIKAFTDPPKGAEISDAESLRDLVVVLTHPDMERQIKVVIARQLGDMDASAMGLDGPNGSVLVTERNKAALKVLSDTIASGKKKIAIFYGAAHMPDMSKRLKEMGFEPVTTHWNQAWDLKIRANQPSAAETFLKNMFDNSKSDNN